jgi:cation:H+ antiporter
MTDAWSIGVGLIVLIVGGELIVRGAARLAFSIGLSPLVVGLTVVAFGTSSPELAVSVGATLAGETDVALGNVIGSNIYNVLLILGLTALLRPLIVRQQLVRFDVPLVIAVSILLWVLVLDGSLSLLEGALLIALLIGYLAASIRIGRRDAASVAAEAAPPIVSSGRPRARSAGLLTAGLLSLVIGAQLLVGGATSLARAFGLPELVIGLTIVALGTSLPELVTSATAVLRGQRDIAVGSVMGSNLFNILGILGLSALLARDGLPVAEQIRGFDIPVMTVVAIACLPLLFTGHVLRRWEGALFLAYGLAYTTYVVLEATRDPRRDLLADALLWFALPLTALTLATVVVRELIARRDPGVRADGESG